jgi:catechol 2,3-dioxygenase-like lactoylglutathione lyase family enzyme
MKVTRFHHVSVNTNDTPLDAMVDFYHDVFGLGDEDRPEIPGIAGHWHTVGDSQLHLVGAPPSGKAIDTTGHHYCVAVDDLDAAIAELDARGIEYVRGLQGESNVQIWIADPAGNTIEIQQENRTQ